MTKENCNPSSSAEQKVSLFCTLVILSGFLLPVPSVFLIATPMKNEFSSLATAWPTTLNCGGFLTSSLGSPNHFNVAREKKGSLVCEVT